MAHEDQRALSGLLSHLRQSLEPLFAACGGDSGSAGDLLLQRLLLGLELLWKLEEQVLMPALQSAMPEHAADVAEGAGELKLMRDLSLQLERSGRAERDLALAALEGLVRLHWARSDALLARATGTAVDWRALHDEVRGLLERWGDEIRAHGEIEDEDRDPVGLPPR
jgi:hypothetical protein